MKTNCSTGDGCLLLACDSDLVPNASAAVNQHEYCIHHVRTFNEAAEYLQHAQPAVVMVELGFDVDRMFDLLNAVRKMHPVSKIVCFRGQPPRVVASCDQAVATVARLIANADFWDLTARKDY